MSLPPPSEQTWEDRVTRPPTLRVDGSLMPHDYPRCGHPRRSSDEKPKNDGFMGVKGQPCLRPAGWGTNHKGVGYCRSHSGTATSGPHGKFNAKLMADTKARREMARFGMHVDISPSQALLAMVHEAAGNVATLGGLIDEMNERDRQATLEAEVRAIGEAVPGEDAGLVDPVTGVRYNLTPDLSAVGRAFVGPIQAANAKTGELYQTTDEVRALVRLYGDWTDRLVKYSKAALDAGVAKAQVEIAKKQAEMLVTIVRRVLTSLDLSAEAYKNATALLAVELRKVANVRIIDGDAARLEAYATGQRPNPVARLREQHESAALRRAER